MQGCRRPPALCFEPDVNNLAAEAPCAATIKYGGDKIRYTRIQGHVNCISDRLHKRACVRIAPVDGHALRHVLHFFFFVSSSIYER